MPLYLVTDTQAPEGTEPRKLVEAATPAGARNRVANERFTVDNTKDFAAAMAMHEAGVQFLASDNSSTDADAEGSEK